MRQEHRPGEKLFVDWAGDKISVYEPDSRAVLRASLFVAVLGASNYTYAEATEDETMSNWIRAHVRAFEFMGGVAELLIPDNTKTGVSKACRYDRLKPHLSGELLHSENVDGLTFWATMMDPVEGGPAASGPPRSLGTTSVSGWAHEYGKRRVVFTAMGHTIHTMWKPQHLKMQKNAVR
jgi:hypothetical protein